MRREAGASFIFLFLALGRANMPTIADIAGVLNVPVPPGAGIASRSRVWRCWTRRGMTSFRTWEASGCCRSLPTAAGGGDGAEAGEAAGGSPPGRCCWWMMRIWRWRRCWSCSRHRSRGRRLGWMPAARVARSAVIGEGAAIAPFVFVGENAKVRARTVLHSGVFIGADTVVGEDCELFPNVVVRERCSLGNRVVIHAGSVIGSDGFGYRWDGTQAREDPADRAGGDRGRRGDRVVRVRGSGEVLGDARSGGGARSTTWCRSRTTRAGAARDHGGAVGGRRVGGAGVGRDAGRAVRGARSRAHGGRVDAGRPARGRWMMLSRGRW